MNSSTQALCFTVKDLESENRSGRIDAHYYDPRYFEMINKLTLMGKKSGMQLSKIESLLNPSKTNLTGGATPKGAAYLSEGVRFIRVQNVKENKIEFENAVFIERRIHEGQLRRSRLKPKNVILTITGSYGIAAVVPDNVGEANINQHSVKMELNEDLAESYYFSHFINSQLCKTQTNRNVTGSTRPALSYPAIRSLLVLFPKDVLVQREIATQISDMYRSAYAKLHERNRLLNTLDNLVIERLGIKLPSEYSKTCFVTDVGTSNRLDALSKSPYLHDLRESIKKMPHDTLEKLVTLPKSSSPDFSDYYRLVDLRKVEEKTGRVKITEVDNLGSNKIVLRKGTICINCLNPEKAKTIFVNEELDGCAASTEFTPIEILQDSVETNYLIAVLRSKVVVDQWKYQITGSTPSRERIGETELRMTLIPKPDRDIQKEIGRNVMDAISKITSLEHASQREIEDAKRLFLERLNSFSQN